LRVDEDRTKRLENHMLRSRAAVDRSRIKRNGCDVAENG
jgi:hypothetical protein